MSDPNHPPVLALQRPAANQAYAWLRDHFPTPSTPFRSVRVAHLPPSPLPKPPTRKKPARDPDMNLRFLPSWDDIHLHLFSDRTGLLFAKDNDAWKLYPTAVRMKDNLRTQHQAVDAGHIIWPPKALFAHAQTTTEPYLLRYMHQDARQHIAAFENGPLFADAHSCQDVDGQTIHPLPFTTRIPLNDAQQALVQQICDSLFVLTPFHKIEGPLLSPTIPGLKAKTSCIRVFSSRFFPDITSAQRVAVMRQMDSVQKLLFSLFYGHQGLLPIACTINLPHPDAPTLLFQETRTAEHSFQPTAHERLQAFAQLRALTSDSPLPASELDALLDDIWHNASL